MSWFLVDDQFPTDPRVMATSLAARGLWATAGAWSSQRHADVVPDHVLAAFGSTPELEAELVTARLWSRTRGGIRFIQQGVCRIPSTETVEKLRQQKTAAQRRWREGQRRRSVDASTGPSTLDPLPKGVSVVTETERSPPPRQTQKPIWPNGISSAAPQPTDDPSQFTAELRAQRGWAPKADRIVKGDLP